MDFHSTRIMDAQSAAEMAVEAVGCGFDLTDDLRLQAHKTAAGGGRLLEIDEATTRELVFPGGAVVADVPVSIKWDKGERIRFCSDVLSFNQMSEQFNQELSLSGKIPCGHFNKMFYFTRCWQKDATATKSLALDGWFITLYTVELDKSQLKLSENVKREIPTSWDPVAIAEFIEKYGTHVIAGVKMGGKDVIHLKQLHTSNLSPSEIQNLLRKLGDQRFSVNIDERSKAVPSTKMKDNKYSNRHIQAALASSFRPAVNYHSKTEDLLSINVRRGGLDLGNHKRWLSTIPEFPNVISMSFVPITSLLNCVQGCGFLSHAINLYLRYKPPMEELAQFLEFQLQRQWAPQYNDLPLGLYRKKDASPSLPYSLLGRKLYVNTVMVDTGNRPVTGMRLFLEGKKSNLLAIHLQHLSSLPKILQLSDEDHYPQNCAAGSSNPITEKEYFVPIKWSIFSHVCTSPIEHHGLTEDAASIVTRAWFEVELMGMKKVLFLRLGFSMVSSSKIRRAEWEGPAMCSRKTGVFSNLISGRFSSNLGSPAANEPHKPDINSAVYPGGPPDPTKEPKLSNIVDMKEMVRGPEDHPGYWVVTGAQLCIVDGKISIKVKYSLLTITSEEDADHLM